MSTIEECLQITVRLIELAQLSEETHRDEAIQEIEDLLEKRSKLLPIIKGPYSSAEMTAGKKLLDLDQELTLQLNRMRLDVRQNINELEQKKTMAARYMNPYAATQQQDGAFYDKRK